jgi:predicted ATPase/DNA-binding CsgD family transcriptional regulator
LGTNGPASAGEGLTRREHEVAGLVAEGLTNRQIAARLFISERTADSHLEQIRQKLGVSSRSLIATWFVTRSRGRAPDQSVGRSRWPPQPTVLVGRDRELAEVRELLLRPEVRLLTVTGPPGTGKTRLSSSVAFDLMADFADGARFVDLSAISHQSLVVSAIAQTVSARPTLESLVAALRPRRCLLLLDNFEQVIGAGGQIAELLASCPDIKAMVTSRECLHLLRWEHEYALQPLRLPDVNHLPPATVLSTVPAVTLFIERARARNADFAINDETGKIVANICGRLDGLPLAIELVAASIKTLPPEQILARLMKGQDLGVRVGADFPKRHRTLARAIDSSYGLLSASEKTLFQRLATFVGGFDLDSMTAVCTGDGVATTESTTLLSQLIDKSLVQVDGGSRRYRLLQTIHEYAQEKLALSGEMDAMNARRANYFVNLAEEAWEAYDGPLVGRWFELMRLETENWRMVIDCAIAERDLETGLRLGAALGYFWWLNGFLDEGQARLVRIVALAEETGEIDDFPQALRELGILTGEQLDHSAGRGYLLKYLEKARATSDSEGVARALTWLGRWAMGEDLGMARHMLEESLELRRECGDESRIPYSLAWLALVVHLQHDDALATSLLDQSLEMARSRGVHLAVGVGLVIQGRIAFDRANYDQAASSWIECLNVAGSAGNVWLFPGLFEYLAKLAIIRNRKPIALRLAGAADAMRKVIGARFDPTWYEDFESRIDASAGGDARHHPEWLAGQALTFDDTVQLASTAWDDTPWSRN